MNSTSTFLSREKQPLFYQTWLPEGQPQAVMVITHGAGEHSGRYSCFARHLPAQGIAIYAYDLRGHGHSPGQRSHVEAFDEYTSDLEQFLKLVRSQHPGVPLFLYAHSMGTLILLSYLLDYSQSFPGAILSGVAYELGEVAPPAQVMLARVLSRLAPRFPVRMKLAGTSLSRDPAVARAYMEDPLVHWERSVRWGTEQLKTVRRVTQRASEIHLPILLLHGEKDPLLLASGARRFYESIASRDKTLRIFPDGLHEPHNDLCQDETAAELAKWIKQRI